MVQECQEVHPQQIHVWLESSPLVTIFIHLSSSSTPPSQTLAAGHIPEVIWEIEGSKPREETETE
jgi:hypothetical protein